MNADTQTPASTRNRAGISPNGYCPELTPVAERVAASLPHDDETKAELALALHGFLESAAVQAHPETIAFVDRRDSFVRRSLDVHVLWSRPLQRADLEEMDELTAEHRKLLGALEQLSPSFNSHLNIVDPRRYRSPNAFATELAATFDVVACYQLVR